VKKLSVGSLCTGYGGLDMAVESFFDAEMSWYSEINRNCEALISHHWSDVGNIGDLTKVNFSKIQKVDILCAGYPCQPYSSASYKRKGPDDERAVVEYITKGISTLRPEWVVLENVNNHRSVGGPAVIASLASLRYDCRWEIVRASDCGAPHKRARLFIVATDSNRSTRTEPNFWNGDRKWEERGINRGTRSDSKRSDFSGSFRKFEPAIRKWETIVNRVAPTPRIGNRINPLFVEFMMGLPENFVTGHGLSKTAELSALGNGVVPQQALLALGRLIK
jgi:DNA (cytosine-5)-methyltransferase 1